MLEQENTDLKKIRCVGVGKEDTGSIKTFKQQLVEKGSNYTVEVVGDYKTLFSMDPNGIDIIIFDSNHSELKVSHYAAAQELEKGDKNGLPIFYFNEGDRKEDPVDVFKDTDSVIVIDKLIGGGENLESLVSQFAHRRIVRRDPVEKQSDSIVAVGDVGVGRLKQLKDLAKDKLIVLDSYQTFLDKASNELIPAAIFDANFRDITATAYTTVEKLKENKKYSSNADLMVFCLDTTKSNPNENLRKIFEPFNSVVVVENTINNDKIMSLASQMYEKTLMSRN